MLASALAKSSSLCNYRSQKSLASLYSAVRGLDNDTTLVIFLCMHEAVGTKESGNSFVASFMYGGKFARRKPLRGIGIINSGLAGKCSLCQCMDVGAYDEVTLRISARKRKKRRNQSLPIARSNARTQC